MELDCYQMEFGNMKKKIFYLLSVLLMVPTSVLADVIDPGPLGPGSDVEDFTVVFITIISIVVIVTIYAIIKNKKKK